MWQLLHPFSLRIIQLLLESIHYDLVNSLDLSIRLGINWCRIFVCNSQITVVSSERFSIKLKAIVRDENAGDPKPSNNVFPDKFLSVQVSDIRQGLSFNPFSKVVHADKQIPLVPCGLWGMDQ